MAIVTNNQVVLKGYVDGTPKETDMELKQSSLSGLTAPKGSSAFLVKNLFLSCDPYMLRRMRQYYGSYIPPFVPGQVLPSPPPSLLRFQSHTLFLARAR